MTPASPPYCPRCEWVRAELVRERSKHAVESANLELSRDAWRVHAERLRTALERIVYRPKGVLERESLGSLRAVAREALSWVRPD